MKQTIIWDRRNTPKLDKSYFFPTIEYIFWLQKTKDSRVKNVYLNLKGDKILNEIFLIQKKRFQKALLKSKSEEVISFNNVIKEIINE